MKGPYERLKYDFRRVWECPLCHRKERVPGTLTTCFCDCDADAGARSMRLIEDEPPHWSVVTASEVSDSGGPPNASSGVNDSGESGDHE
ncbi:MAG: hypothetical protein KDA60_16660 [Planctomycetales bacterium]|nr:hypothetical protein [Planctomycetales bacterium]